MSKEVTYIIYRILNIKTRKFYIGKTKQTLKKRWSVHKAHGKYGYKKNGKSYLYLSMKKYGVESFEIKQIDTAYGVEHSKWLETFYIKYYNSCDSRYGYNLIYDSPDGGIWQTHEEKIKNGKRIRAKRIIKNGSTGVYFCEINGQKKKNPWMCKFMHLGKGKAKRFKTQQEATECYDMLYMHVMNGEIPPNHPEKIEQYLKVDLKAHFEDFYKEIKKSSKYFYVSKSHSYKTWSANINLGSGNNLYLGEWKTEEEAAIAHDKARFYYGIERGRYNFPDLVKNYDKEDIEPFILECRDPLRQIGRQVSSKYRGVTKHKQCVNLWCWEYKDNGKRIRGTSQCEILAAETRDMGVLKVYGDKAILNFPEKLDYYKSKLAAPQN